MRVPWRRARSRPPAKTRRRDPPFAALAPANLGDIEAQARYHRDPLALYRARMHGSQATSMVRLRELERAATAAEDRLRTARRQADREHPV